MIKPIERSANDEIIVYQEKKSFIAQVISQSYDEVYTNKNVFKIILKENDKSDEQRGI